MHFNACCDTTIYIFEECRLLWYQRHKYRLEPDKKETEQRIYHSIHEHNLSVNFYTNRNSKLKVQSQAVKLLTRGGVMVRRSDPSVPANRDYRLC